jgi:hypothetical protein
VGGWLGNGVGKEAGEIGKVSTERIKLHEVFCGDREILVQPLPARMMRTVPAAHTRGCICTLLVSSDISQG